VTKDATALLLHRRRDQIPITGGVVEAAAGNEGHRKDIIELVLGQQDDSPQLRGEVLVAGSKNRGGWALQLDQLDDKVEITEDIPTTVMVNWACGGEILNLLLFRKDNHMLTTIICQRFNAQDNV
jgi:hypothetical protein